MEQGPGCCALTIDYPMLRELRIARGKILLLLYTTATAVILTNISSSNSSNSNAIY